LGTSHSHRSPKTLLWAAAVTAYTSENILPSRAIEEVWKAIKSQPDSNFVEDLRSPIVAKCLQISLRGMSPEQTSVEVSRTIALSGQSSIATDIARRAAVFSARNPQDRINSFVQYLFSKAFDYLVSRDLSGYIGYSKRTRNVSSSIEYKNSMQNEVKKIVSDFPPPEGLERETEIWDKYIDDITLALAGVERNGI
jgi:hypothetical protein